MRQNTPLKRFLFDHQQAIDDASHDALNHTKMLQTEQYRKELDGVANIMAQQKELADTVANPLYNLEERQKVFQAIIDKLKLSKVMSSFLMLLFEKGRVSFIISINEFFQKLADELKGVASASLVSATELSAEAIEKIRSALSKKTGKEIVLEVEQDPGLIGGIVTKIGDLVLDGSIKTQLLNMRESLKRGESA
jgi:F-type H+-transporting ATPase subunit delta